MSSFEDQIIEEKFMESLSRYARKITKDIDRAEDLVQSTYEKMLNRKDQFEGNYVLPWAITIMKNTLTDSHRKITEDQFIDEKDPEIEDNDNQLDSLISNEESKINSQRVHFCLKKLDIESRDVLHYREDGFSYKQISNMLSFSVASLRVKMLRAKESMRLCLEGVSA